VVRHDAVPLAEAPLPDEEYRRRLDARRAEHARLGAVSARLSALRLGTVLLFVLVAWATLRAGWGSPLWMGLPAAGFLALARWHDRVLQAEDRAARAVAWYERALARLAGDWAGRGEPGTAFLREPSLFAADLDLFGDGSLFELLSTARTASGERMLAGWLLHPAMPAVVLARQAAVRDLATRHDVREDLALAGPAVRAAVDPHGLVRWATAPPALRGGWPRRVVQALGAAALAAGAAWLVGVAGPAPLLSVLGVNALVGAALRRRVLRVLHSASEPGRELAVLATVLARIEREPFDAVRLSELRGRLAAIGGGPWSAIHHLGRVLERHDWQHNPFFAPLGAAVLWGTQCAWAVEAWRARHGAHVPEWLEVAAEVEALAALGTYAFEHPADPFPDLCEAAAVPTFDAGGLGHPLLDAPMAVANDVRLDAACQLLVVSGSNMSGKSTLLRAVGVNAVLAFAGAPVRARRLRLSPLALGATLRVQDSLQAGRSRFYAEITRVREVAGLARGGQPVLFLFDELFHGTNSHDRVAGAGAVLGRFLDHGAIGLVTTHDLALAAVADRLAPRAANVHFEDRFEGGEIRFDYRLRPGPVTRSNALALMHAVGLEVEPGAADGARHAPTASPSAASPSSGRSPSP
jgi:hypothetical protein